MRFLASLTTSLVLMASQLLPTAAQGAVYDSAGVDNQLAGIAFGMVYRLCREVYLFKTIGVQQVKTRSAADKKYLAVLAKRLNATKVGLSDAQGVYESRWRKCLVTKETGDWDP